MIHLNVFFNCQIKPDSDQGGIPLVGKMGNYCLTPVRYLFMGDSLAVSAGDEKETTVRHYKCFYKAEKSWLRVVGAVILLFPGMIIGSALKGLSFLYASIRENHRLAVLSYAPTKNVCLGSNEERLDYSKIYEQINTISKENPLQQPVEEIKIWGAGASAFIGEVGLDMIVGLLPRKIIFIDIPINLNNYWNLQIYCPLEDQEPKEGSSKWARPIVVHKANSVEEALNDIPPRLSWVSLSRFTRIYSITTLA